MPGTCGAAAAIAPLFFVPAEHLPWTLGVLALASLAIAPSCAEVAIRRMNRKDPQCFVLDEAVGVWIAAWRPGDIDWRVLLMAFVLFRVFDITKPWPVRSLERLPGGYGVVYDDVAAGIMALAVGWLLQAAMF